MDHNFPNDEGQYWALYGAQHARALYDLMTGLTWPNITLNHAQDIGGQQRGQVVLGVQVVDQRRVVQALHVVGVAEDRRALRRLVRADALEHRRSVVQRVRHHVDGGLGPRHQLAIEPDEFGQVLAHGRFLVVAEGKRRI